MPDNPARPVSTDSASSPPLAQVTLADIQAAHARLAPYLAPTPLHEATSLTARVGVPVFAKLESMNPTGAFKVRGALNAVLSLDQGEREHGVVTASAGSHGLGVAFAARSLGVAAHIFLPSDASPAKVAKLRRLGAILDQSTSTYDDAHHAAAHFAATTSRPYIHAYADPTVIAGQGTVGLEIVAQLPDVRAIVVPVGGGGLITGITTAVQSLGPDIRILAAQPAASPALSRSLADGVVHETFDAAPTIAEALAGGVGREVVDLARRGLIHRVIDVPEPAIRAAVAWVVREEQWLIEGGAAVAVAPLLQGLVVGPGPLCIVLTGSNIAASLLLEVVASV